VGGIAVNGENLPMSTDGDGANQEIDCRSGYTPATALVVQVGRFFPIYAPFRP
jgi:hypothetical protein